MSYGDNLYKGDTYFANMSFSEIGDEIMERQRQWQGHMMAIGRLRLIRDSYSLYYGQDRDNTGSTSRRVTRKKKGEILDIQLNHYGNIVKALKQLTTAQRPAFEPKAKNTDSDAQAETILCSALLDDYINTKNLVKLLKRWVAHAIKYTAGWFAVCWNPNLGPPVGPDDNGNISPTALKRDPQTLQVTGTVNEGDCDFHNYTALDVAFDYRTPSDELEWINCRRFVNRYGLRAQYPELASTIMDVDTDMDISEFRLSYERRSDMGSGINHDLIPIFDFWHEKTPAVPTGRHVTLLSDGTVLPDKTNPNGLLLYDEIPVYPLRPDEHDDTAHGHAPVTDLMGIQQAVNASGSHVITKQNASLPRIATPENANLAPVDLNVGMGIFKYRGAQPPTVFQTTGTAKEDVDVCRFMQGQMETLSGVNPVTRGNPEDALRQGSGTALALIVAQSVQSNSDLQDNFYLGLGKVGTGIVRCHQLFNKHPRKLEILAGKGRAAQAKFFTGAHLSSIGNVTVTGGSPLLQQNAGRMQLLEGLMKMGTKLDPQRLISFVETGKWEVVVEDPSTEDMFIRAENEALRTGKMVPKALWTENPQKHVLGHMMGVLNSIEAKINPKVQSATIEHIQSHLDAWQNADPAGLMLLGYPPPPPPPMPTQPPGALGMPPGPPQLGAGPPAGPPGPPGPGPLPPPAGKGHGNPAPVLAPHIPGPLLPQIPKQPNGAPTPIPGVRPG